MSYIKIWIHCVWSTKNRRFFITKSIRPFLLSHIRDYARKKSVTLDYINAHRNHVHALVKLDKEQNIAEIMRLIKGESSVWMNRSKLMKTRFEWQDDYFATSVSNSHVDRVRRYIKNQDEHHRKLTWDEEVDLFLKRYGFERMKG
ncbi:MAG: IS200/IS605 family transposase [Prolixibacteraceae bacterium]|jgi:REP element-mobilizing transposase RayT|nr:IS200/IS605 family transposase [Prolixibacteraceae bacterium]NLO01604.1 IS200/IS605 family transposase [Bacteroidales bacterium]